MVDKRSVPEEKTEGDFGNDKGEGKKPKPETESPPLSPTDPSLFDMEVTGPFSTDYDDDVDPRVYHESDEHFPVDIIYPTDRYHDIYTPEILSGFAEDAIKKYNQDQQTTYTFEKLDKVLSSCSLQYYTTFTIIFTAAASDGVSKRFKAYAVTGYDDGPEVDIILSLDSGSDSCSDYDPDIDYYAITILKVDLFHLFHASGSPPQ